MQQSGSDNDLTAAESERTEGTAESQEAAGSPRKPRGRYSLGKWLDDAHREIAAAFGASPNATPALQEWGRACKAAPDDPPGQEHVRALQEAAHAAVRHLVLHAEVWCLVCA